MAELEKEIKIMRKDIEYIKRILSEDFELSERAKKLLKEARETSEEDYVEL